MTGGSLKLPFVAALATSAFLLFTLELFAGREVLPVFGGAPGVWATALCFFSGVLFLGYGYAHLSVTRLGTRRGGLVHLVVAIVLVAVSTQAPASVASLRHRWGSRSLERPVGAARHCRSSGISARLDHAAPVGLVRRHLRRRVVALRRVQCREPAGPAGVPVPDRAAATAFRSARCAPHRPRRLRAAAGGDRRSPASQPGHGSQRRHCSGDPTKRRRRATAATPAAVVADRGLHSCRAPDGDHELPDDRPRFRAPPVGGTAGDLPGELRRRLFRARPPTAAGHRDARAGSRDAALAAVCRPGRLAGRPAGRDRARVIRRPGNCSARPIGGRPS